MQPNCSCFWPLLELGPQQDVQGTPEAVGAHNYKVNYLPLVTWTYPATNRLLLEAGASANVFDNNTLRTDPSVGLDTIAITELSTNFRYGSRALGIDPRRGLPGAAQPAVPPARVDVLHHRARTRSRPASR